MATLTIKNPHYAPNKRRAPSYHVYLDGKAVGAVSGPAQTLELDIPAGSYTLHLKSAQFLGKSNRLNIVVGEQDHLHIHFSEKNAIYMMAAIGFLALYYLLRVYLDLNFLVAAAIGVAALYSVMALLQPLQLQQVSP